MSFVLARPCTEVSENKFSEPSIMNTIDKKCLGIINPKIGGPIYLSPSIYTDEPIYSEMRDVFLMKSPLMV